MKSFDNSSIRLHDTFFYGLYMDPDILRSKGVEPRLPRKASAPGYQLRIGKMATLLRVPEAEAEAHGMVYALTHAEIHTLYWGSGLDAYVAEAVLVKTEQGDILATLCCNLLQPPADHESNPEYRDKLKACLQKLGLPNIL